MKYALGVLFVALVVMTTEAARADEPPAPADLPPVSLTPVAPKKARGRFELQGGMGADHFFNLIFRRYDIGLALAVDRETYELVPELHIQPGVSEFGLLSFRNEIGASFANKGRFRVIGGLHLAYTMILRNSRKNPFYAALTGDIAGLGAGAHAGVAVDLIHDDSFTLFLNGRGFAEAFDGGAGYGATAGLGVGFAP